MSWRDLFRRMPDGAKRAARGATLRQRLAVALEPPPSRTIYTVPMFRRLDAVLFAARGYVVGWPAMERVADQASSSVLAYHVKGGAPKAGTDWPRWWWCELPTVFPGRVTVAAAHLRHIVKGN